MLVIFAYHIAYIRSFYTSNLSVSFACFKVGISCNLGHLLIKNMSMKLAYY